MVAGVCREMNTACPFKRPKVSVSSFATTKYLARNSLPSARQQLTRSYGTLNFLRVARSSKFMGFGAERLPRYPNLTNSCKIPLSTADMPSSPLLLDLRNANTDSDAQPARKFPKSCSCRLLTYRHPSSLHFSVAAGAVDRMNDLLIIGPGVLGGLVGKLWMDANPGVSVVGQTNTSANHKRCEIRQLELLDSSCIAI